MKGPERIETARLLLRKPVLDDAEAVFSRYASDPEVTKYLAWPRHGSIEHTRLFLRFSDAEWERWPVGPYLIEFKDDLQLLGGTGLAFETRTIASTGYVLARDAWGRGYATEALVAIVTLARELGVAHLYALCHPDHPASVRVLEKCNFICVGVLPQQVEFPNLNPGHQVDCLRFTRNLH
jgi:ribosomal-protein-alanine N-acetyltransferase